MMLQQFREFRKVGANGKVNLTVECVHISTSNKETGWLIVESRDIPNSKEKCKLSCGMRSDSIPHQQN